MSHQIKITDFAEYTREIVLASTTKGGKRLIMEINPGEGKVWFHVESCAYGKSFDNLLDAISHYNFI